MRKLTALLLSFAVMIGFSACGAQSAAPGTASRAASAPAAESESRRPEQPEEEAMPAFDPAADQDAYPFVLVGSDADAVLVQTGDAFGPWTAEEVRYTANTEQVSGGIFARFTGAVEMTGRLELVDDTVMGATTCFFKPDPSLGTLPAEYASPEVEGFYLQVDPQVLYAKFGEPTGQVLFEGEPFGVCYESCTVTVTRLQIWSGWGGKDRGMNTGYLYDVDAEILDCK